MLLPHRGQEQPENIFLMYPPHQILQRSPIVLFALLLSLAPAFAQQEANLSLLARPHGDSITLRWAPTTYSVWLEMQRFGVMLERRIAGSDDWTPVHGERLLAYSVEDFTAFTNTDDPHIVAVAEALHGEAEYPATPPAGPMGEVRQKMDETEQRMFLALVNADLSAAAATALGWRWTDRGLTPGVPYEYRVRTLPAEGKTDSRFTSAPLRVRANDRFPFGPVFGLKVEEGEQKLTLSWPLDPNRRRYIAYHLEVSEDGDNFRRTNPYPFFKTQPQEGEEDFRYEVKLEENYRPKYYRLVGVNSFAEEAPPSAAVRGQGIDKTPPPALSDLRAEDLRDGSFRLRWTFPKATPPDVRGYVVVRGYDYKGPFAPAHDEVLEPLATEFVDEAPIPYQANYYAVYTYDTAGNYSMSTPAMALWQDEEPPAEPTGITGRIDTLGNVFLMWEPGAEPDLHGYRVYVSHAKKREFLQVTPDILHRNYFFDSTRLDVLNERVYYRVVAVDNNYNPSAYSEILELERPDKIPPSAPIITGYAGRGDAVELRFRPSTSVDVDHHEVWRMTAGEDWRPLRSLGPRDSVFLDTNVVARTEYTYRVRALDEVSLFADSAPLSLRSGTASRREGVEALALTQVPGQDRWELNWSVPNARAVGFQVYMAPANSQLRPLRRLPAEAESWVVPQATNHRFALQIIYPDGSRSPLSEVINGPKK